MVSPTGRFFQPIFSTADELQREEDVLEWLVENKATGDEDDVIEEVNAKTLKTLIANIDNLVVLFCRCFPLLIWDRL